MRARERQGDFGQIRTLELRNSARFVHSARWAIPLVRFVIAHICAEIVQYHEFSKVGSNPVRVALVFISVLTEGKKDSPEFKRLQKILWHTRRKS